MFGLGNKANNETNTSIDQGVVAAPAGEQPASSVPTEGSTSPDSNASSIASTPPETPPTNDADLSDAAVPAQRNIILPDITFEEFVDSQITDFLNVMEIDDVNDRREAVIDLCPDEKSIAHRLAMASAFHTLWAAYSNHTGDEGSVQHANGILAKIKAIKLWLGF